MDDNQSPVDVVREATEGALGPEWAGELFLIAVGIVWCALMLSIGWRYLRAILTDSLK